VATKGIATALTQYGNSIDLFLPRVTGLEEEIPGVNLWDFKRKKHLLTETELAGFVSKFLKFFHKNYPISAYGSAGENPEDLKKTEKEFVEQYLSGIKRDMSLLDDFLTGNYSKRIYQEINVFADWVSLMASKSDFDIIHAHDWMTYKAALGAQVVSGKPLVCHVHSTEFDRSGDNVNQYIYDLERETFHRASVVITVSDFTRRILVDRYGVPVEKIRTVHNGVDIDLADLEKSKVPKKRKIAPKGKIVTFVGRITFQKGPDYFVRAARKVIHEIPDVKFVMAGTGDMYYRMIELAADMGMGSYFHYTGFMDKEGVNRLYNLSDLYVMPSVSEPFGITPLEAMLHKVPVIISKQSGVSEVIQNAVKIDFWDVNQISDNIIYILKDKKTHQKLMADGFNEAAGIKWGNAAQKINNIYEETLYYAARA
jgi:glycosyltransferase involved in cell wall biosynthesis